MSGHYALRNARVTLLNPDGTIFIDRRQQGDFGISQLAFLTLSRVWPADASFLLAFDQGMFSEDNTFLLSEWVRIRRLKCCRRTLIGGGALTNLPQSALYIFPSDLPKSLAEDKQQLAGKEAVFHPVTLQDGAMSPTKRTTWGRSARRRTRITFLPQGILLLL